MYKVLIIEDDPMVAMINEQYVKMNKDFEVIGRLPNGDNIVEFLSKNQTDLIILDVFMPHTDGFETLKKIRNMQITVDVVMVTAANDRESLEKAMRLGIIDYLVKPFTADRFRMALNKFAAQKSALKSVDTFCQASIDHIMDNTHKNAEAILPKGIQEKTLSHILCFLDENPTEWFTGDEISKNTGLTGVTVRRYMNYLAEVGRALSEINYETGGRPCMRYKST